jgi:hypothetical protein
MSDKRARRGEQIYDQPRKLEVSDTNQQSEKQVVTSVELLLSLTTDH